MLAIIFFCCFTFLKGQDKLFFSNGNTKKCKVVEVGPEYLTIQEAGETIQISKSDVVAIEYPNGNVDIFDNAVREEKPDENLKDVKRHMVSMNTLALCNSDLAAFYEFTSKNKQFGLGAMGAYNFNQLAGMQNSFIAVLPNGRKNFDLGAYFNFYWSRLRRKTNFYTGIMFKYTSISFNTVNNNSSAGASSVVSYSPARGSQKATMLMMGTHTFITQHFFIRTLAGLGAFRLHGDYKKELNNQLQPVTGDTFNSLPKMYLGINAGFFF